MENEIMMSDLHTTIVESGLYASGREECTVLPIELVLRPALEMAPAEVWHEISPAAPVEVAVDAEYRFYEDAEEARIELGEEIVIGSMGSCYQPMDIRGMQDVIACLLHTDENRISYGAAAGVARALVSLVNRGVLEDYPAREALIGLYHDFEVVDAGMLLQRLLTWEPPVPGMPLDFLIEVMAAGLPQQILEQGDEEMAEGDEIVRYELLDEAREREVIAVNAALADGLQRA